MFTWILVDRVGERTIVMFPNVLVRLSESDVTESHAAYIAQARVLHTEICALPLAPVARAMEIAREAGVTTVFDLDVSPRHFIEEAGLGTRQMLEHVLSLTDVLVPCKAAALELLEEDGDLIESAGRLLRYGPQAVVITLGAEGSLYVDRDRSFTTRGFPVGAVDTTGAGDAFHGGLIYGLLQGMKMEGACELANACGAYCCTGLGARHMATLSEIRVFMAEGRGGEPE
jgi:sugar/nucleoside kinase (ribokinase family)